MLSNILSELDTDNIEIVGDEEEKGKEYNLSRCEGILLFIALYVGFENFVPVSAGVFKGIPAVHGQFEGYGPKYFIKEAVRVFKGPGFEYTRTAYLSNSRFYTFLKSVPEPISQCHVLID